MSGRPTQDDLLHLEHARALARRGWGRVHPNPMVGCVLVREGRIVGEGHHREFGGPHAEVEALAEAGDAARNATAYVSLEPCAHHGKTPPCADALVEAGVERVVYGAADPGSESGGGGRRLREAGVEVLGPVLSREEARRDNPAFFHLAEHDTAYLEAKLAVSLDGGIAAGPGRRTPVTGEEALDRVHRLRAGFDAILVGSRTVEVDDPRLTVRRGVPVRKQPARLVVDTRCRTSPDAALFDDVDRADVTIFCSADAGDRGSELEAAGARIVPLPASGRGVSLPHVLAWCREHDLGAVLCEGGGELVTSLLEAGLCRRLDLFVAPRVLGSGAVPAFPSGGGESLLEGWRIIHAEGGVGRDGVLVLEPGGDGKGGGAA